MVDREGTHGQVAIKEVTDKSINPHKVIGVTVFFPFIQPITERIGDEESTLGYLCHMGNRWFVTMRWRGNLFYMRRKKAGGKEKEKKPPEALFSNLQIFRI